jgi:hypothetical protein
MRRLSSMAPKYFFGHLQFRCAFKERAPDAGKDGRPYIFLFYLFVLSKPGRLAGKARPSGFFVLSFISRSDNFNF